MVRVFDQEDQGAGKDGLLENRQVHVFAPWRQMIIGALVTWAIYTLVTWAIYTQGQLLL